MDSIVKSNPKSTLGSSEFIQVKSQHVRVAISFPSNLMSVMLDGYWLSHGCLFSSNE